MKITQHDQETFDFVLRYKQEHNGNSPSCLEIVANTRQSSTSTVVYSLEKLNGFGLIQWDGGTRQIEVIGWEFRKISK